MGPRNNRPKYNSPPSQSINPVRLLPFLRPLYLPGELFRPAPGSHVCSPRATTPTLVPPVTLFQARPTSAPDPRRLQMALESPSLSPEEHFVLPIPNLWGPRSHSPFLLSFLRPLRPMRAYPQLALPSPQMAEAQQGSSPTENGLVDGLNPSQERLQLAIPLPGIPSPAIPLPGPEIPGPSASTAQPNPDMNGRKVKDSGSPQILPPPGPPAASLNDSGNISPPFSPVSASKMRTLSSSSDADEDSATNEARTRKRKRHQSNHSGPPEKQKLRILIPAKILAAKPRSNGEGSAALAEQVKHQLQIMVPASILDTKPPQSISDGYDSARSENLFFTDTDSVLDDLWTSSNRTGGRNSNAEIFQRLLATAIPEGKGGETPSDPLPSNAIPLPFARQSESGISQSQQVHRSI